MKGAKYATVKSLQKEGINVNFVEIIDDDEIYVRTYERGVEDETLSCGTGVTASALISAHNDNGFNRVEVKTKGGRLSVEFEKISETEFKNIWLCGPAEFVFKGEVKFKRLSMFNIRVYGILINEQKQVLVSDEFIRGNYYTKFPGGGLELGEGTRDCLKKRI